MMIHETSRAVARALLDIGAVGFTPDAPVTFKSGLISPVYVDNRRLPYWPAQWRTVVHGFQAVLAAQSIDFDVLAGVEVGGIPHCAALAYMLGKPSVIVRKQAKAHGMQNRIEGGDVENRRVLLVEDLVTTGGSSLSGVEALREAGAVVDDCLAIVSYGFDAAQRAFARAGVRLHTLTSFAVILDEAVQQGGMSVAAQETVLDWLRDPSGWAVARGYHGPQGGE